MLEFFDAMIFAKTKQLIIDASICLMLYFDAT